MTRHYAVWAALAATLSLAGCNETTGGMGPVATAPPGPPTRSALPPGAPCTKEINQFQTIVQADLATGNVEQKVYDQIQTEMARAASACAAGKGGEAHALVAASKARHGYRA